MSLCAGVWTIDHDDGSQFFNDTGNVMAWGGCKNYLGHSKSCDHNVIIHPGVDQRAAGSMPCQVASGVFENQYHDNNHCFTADGIFYADGSMRGCTSGDISSHVYQTFNNKLYSGGNVPGGNFTAPGPCTARGATTAQTSSCRWRCLRALRSAGSRGACGKLTRGMQRRIVCA